MCNHTWHHFPDNFFLSLVRDSIQDLKFGGEAIVDNVASCRGWVLELDVFPPAQSAKTEVFYDLAELKKAKFQLLCDSDKRWHYMSLK